MCDGCRTIAPGLRLVAALTAGATLAARPTPTARAHVYIGPLTPTGRTTRGARPWCGTRTLPLTVIPHDLNTTRMTTAGRRFCARCLRALPAALDTTTREPVHAHLRAPRGAAWNTPATVYANLPVHALAAAARWARTVEETHQIGHTLGEVHGPKPYAPRPALEGKPAALALWDAHQIVHKRRRVLTSRETDPEVRAARIAERDAATADAIEVDRRRREADRLDRLAAMHRAGRYLMPHERAQLEHARRTAR